MPQRYGHRHPDVERSVLYPHDPRSRRIGRVGSSRVRSEQSPSRADHLRDGRKDGFMTLRVVAHIKSKSDKATEARELLEGLIRSHKQGARLYQLRASAEQRRSIAADLYRGVAGRIGLGGALRDSPYPGGPGTLGRVDGRAVGSAQVQQGGLIPPRRIRFAARSGRSAAVENARRTDPRPGRPSAHGGLPPRPA